MQKDSAVPDCLERFVSVLEHMTGHDVAYQVEAAKIALSAAETAPIALDMVEAGLKLTTSRSNFEAASSANLAAILASLNATLAAAGVTPAQISTLVFTGGAAQMPLLRHTLRKALPDAAVYEAHAFASVASGLAVDAARRFG